MEDNFGRNVNRVQITAEELLAETQNVTINAKADSAASFDKLNAVVEELSKKIGDLPIKELTSNASSWVNEIVKLREEIGMFNKSSDSSVKNKSFDQSLLENFKKYHNDFKNRDNGLWVGISRFSELAQTQLLRTLRKILKPGGAGDTEPLKENYSTHTGGGGGGRNIISLAGNKGGGGFGGKGGEVLGNELKNFLYTLTGFATSIVQKSMELTGMHWTDVFTGVKDLFDHERKINAIIYQKERISLESTKKVYKQGGEYYSQLASELGAWPGEIQKAWQETIQRGITLEESFVKDRLKKEGKLHKAEEVITKRRERLMKDSVFTATYLNMGIESVNEMFNDWHTELGLTASQMSSVSKEMINISRSTGLVGKNLEKTLKSSESIMKSMRGLGLLNSTSAKTIMKMNADFQRFGFGEEGQQFLQKLTNGAALSDPRFGSLAAQMAGGDNELFTEIAAGRALNKVENRKTMGRNLESTLLHDVSGIIGADQVKSIEAQLGESISIDNLQRVIEMTDASTQLRLNTIIQQKYDNDIMAVAAITKTFKESGKTYEERLGELNLQIQKNSDNAEVVKVLKKRKSHLEEEILSTGFDYLREEMERNKGDSQKAAESLRKRMDMEYGSGTSKLFENVDSSFGNMMSKLKEQAKDAGLDFNALVAQTDLKNEKTILESIKSKDSDVRDMGFDALNSIRQNILNKERAAQDPYTNMEQTMKELNGTVQDLISTLKGVMGPLGPPLMLLGGFLSSVAGTLINVGLMAASINGLFNMGKGLANLAGFGKAGAAGAAGAGATGKGKGWFGGSKVYDVNGKPTIDAKFKRLPAPDMPHGGPKMPHGGGKGPSGKGFWKAIDNITSFFGGGGGAGRAKRYAAWAAVAATGGYLGSKMIGSKQDNTNTDIPLEAGQTIPVYVTNWEEICRCTGIEGVKGGIPGEPISTTMPPIEKEKTNFQRTADIATASNNAGQWATAIGAGMYKTGQKVMSKGGQEVAEQLAIKGGQKLATKAGGKLMSKLVPGLDIGIDAISGAAYAEDNNRGLVEGGVLGALTGDSSVGSDFFSPMLGVEKGTVWDKALGVFGAGLRGAFNGGAIGGAIGGVGGSVAPGVGNLLGLGSGALIGGAVGGSIGALAELYKLWTDQPVNPPQTITIPIEKKPSQEEYKPSIDNRLSGAFDQMSKQKTYASYGNGLDYTEETGKPYISSNTYNREETVAAMLEKRSIGKSPMLSMPNMDSVNDYLTKIQSDKLDMMIAELRGIRTNTNATTNSLVSSSLPNMSSIASRSSLQKAANGMTRGAWGLQAGINTQNDVLSDGRFI